MEVLARLLLRLRLVQRPPSVLELVAIQLSFLRLGDRGFDLVLAAARDGGLQGLPGLILPLLLLEHAPGFVELGAAKVFAFCEADCIFQRADLPRLHGLAQPAQRLEAGLLLDQHIPRCLQVALVQSGRLALGDRLPQLLGVLAGHCVLKLLALRGLEVQRLQRLAGGPELFIRQTRSLPGVDRGPQVRHVLARDRRIQIVAGLDLLPLLGQRLPRRLQILRAQPRGLAFLERRIEALDVAAFDRLLQLLPCRLLALNHRDRPLCLVDLSRVQLRRLGPLEGCGHRGFVADGYGLPEDLPRGRPLPFAIH
mmetsp:Transcript_110268/g.318697  ORF Transcript_110268/g.318697 Transcript_110268/m.318697 type:complete len:310 (+) Transcript_110268:3001-3930(+)